MTQQRYLIIPEWMLDLGLNASELHAYALIWGFSQDGESDFHGAASYVARWCGVTERQVHTILKNLTSRGLIKKTVTPGYPAHYTTTGSAIIAQGGEKIAPLKNLHGGYEVFSYPTPEEISPNNKERDNKDIINRESVLRAREDDGKEAYGTKVRMTPDEYAKIVSRYGSEDAAAMVQMLDDYLVDHPRKHYANHYRAAIGWPAQRLMEQRTAEQRLKNAQEAAQRVNGQQQAAASTWTAEDLARIRRFEEKIDRERNGLL